MATVIDSLGLLPAMHAAPRAIALVAVAWSPWHRRSRLVLDALEASRAEWSPNSPVGFFVLWPEEEDELRRWYEELCRQHAPRFELHGHGYGPLWWLVEGQVVDCMSRPYEAGRPALQERSARAFRTR